jgi:hypothetical protein
MLPGELQAVLEAVRLLEVNFEEIAEFTRD